MPGLVSDQLLNNLRNVAYRQLVTPVTIERFATVAGPADTTKSWTTVVDTTGWLVGKNTPAIQIGVEERSTIDALYELRLRQGTDCTNGDRVLIGGAYYAVIDVNAEVTISLFLKASLRRVS
jgi:hypothetical protein